MTKTGRGNSGQKADLARESILISLGHRFIAGVDEVGRGPLAGPVAAAAVVLDPARPVPGLNDSKAMSAAMRERLFPEILLKAHASIVFLPVSVIDALNIRNASLEAMRQAVSGLAVSPDFALIDGRDIPPGLACPAEAIIGGDRRSASIAAASIVAKVLRDRMMSRADMAFPGYEFSRHAGYGTLLHRSALAALGPSDLHRRSFKLG